MNEDEIRAHEAQRVAPDDVLEAVTRFLADRFGGGRVIDAGAGAGSMTRLIAPTAATVVCVDVSMAMLGALRANELAAIPAVNADVHHLPLADGRADGAMLANVLHLVPDWPAVLAEVARCLRPGGEIVVNLGSPDGGWSLAAEVRDWLGIDVSLTGMISESDLADEMRSLGGRVSAVFEREWPTRRTVRAEIDRLVNNPFAWPAGTDRAALAHNLGDRQDDAVRRFGPLDAVHEVARPLRLTAYRVT